MSFLGTLPEWVQAAAAIAALVGLYWYTRYTRQIRDATLYAQRAQVEPLLLCVQDQTQPWPTYWISNAGNGVGLNLKVAVIPAVRHLGTFFDIGLSSAEQLGDLLQNSGHTTFRIPDQKGENGQTIIVQVEDVNGELHQLQLLISFPQHGSGRGRIVETARVSDRKSGPRVRKRPVLKDRSGRNS